MGLEPIPAASQPIFIVLVFVVTFALPALNIWILKSFRLVGSVKMEERGERIFPFILICMIYIGITYMFYWKSRIDLSDNFMKMMIVIDALVIAATIATFFFKVSVHSLAIWGNIGILIPLNKITGMGALFFPVLAVIVLAGLIMSSRMMTGVHSLKEVLWGSIIGLATSVAGMLILY
jgi:hypothetical protein